MSKLFSKKTVELEASARPSRIRRDPPGRLKQKTVQPYPSEREVWAVVIGVILFALALTIITVSISEYTSH
jgi:hypothetical protein